MDSAPSSSVLSVLTVLRFQVLSGGQPHKGLFMKLFIAAGGGCCLNKLPASSQMLVADMTLALLKLTQGLCLS